MDIFVCFTLMEVYECAQPFRGANAEMQEMYTNEDNL